MIKINLLNLLKIELETQWKLHQMVKMRPKVKTKERNIQKGAITKL